MAPNSPRARRPGGARSARTSLGDRLRAWRHHPRDSLRDALNRMRAAPSSGRRSTRAAHQEPTS